MVAEVVHGAPYRFRDPARFSLAHGGKDRHPYPVPIKVYDETIRVLKTAVQNAKLGRDEEMQTLRRLDDQARRLERTASGPSFEDFVEGELRASPALGGRSVFGQEEEQSGEAVGKEMKTRLPHVMPLTLKSKETLALSALLMKPRNARACFVFAHGAGAGMTHPFMEDVAAKLYGYGIATLRFQFPFMETGSKRPDTPAVAHGAIRLAVAEAAPSMPRDAQLWRAASHSAGA